jgi:hypothetical protein
MAAAPVPDARWSLIRPLLPASMPKPQGGPEKGCHISVKRPDHGGVEVFVTDRVSSRWFRTGAPDDDHDVRCGIYVDRLSEDAAS